METRPSFIAELKQENTNQLGAIPAQRLLEKLNRTSTYIEQYQRRWFWELLQNANDACEESKTIGIVLKISNTEINFTHTGKPFTTRDMLNLVRPNSDKSEADESVEDDKSVSPIGKFGTGLISTHILSSLIKIQGIVQGKGGEINSFQVKLDRHDTSKSYLIEELSREYDELEASIKPATTYSFGDIAASFTYDLRVSLPNISRFIPTDEYMEYLYDVIPYTMSFLPKIGSIKIEDNRTTSQVFFCKVAERKEDEIHFAITTEKGIVAKTFKYFGNEKVQVVFECDGNRICAYPKSLPKLFCGLPLVGTEEVGLPIIVNSTLFTPSDERDSVELLPDQFSGNIDIIRQAFELYKTILNYAETNQLLDIYNLMCLSDKYKSPNPASCQQFVKIFLEPVIDYVKTKKIVQINDGSYIAFGGAKMPYADPNRIDSDLYDISSYIKKQVLPRKEDYEHWMNVINFTLFRDMTYKLENLLDDVEALGKTNLVGESNLHEILSYALNSKEGKNLVTVKTIIPNQEGNLCKQSDIFIDDNIPATLKTIYNLLFEAPIEEQLLNQQFEDLDVVTTKKNIKEISETIDQEIKKQYLDRGSVKDIITPVNTLYDWINEQQTDKKLTKEYLRSAFPWFLDMKESLLLEAFSERDREKVLKIAQSPNLERLSQLADCDPSIVGDVVEKVSAELKAAQQGLSKKQQEEWNQIAREKALAKLKSQNYKVPSLQETHGSIINRVLDSEGMPHVVLVKCAIQNEIYMEPTEWGVLFSNPQSIFAVYDGRKVYMQKARILFQNQDLLQITFSTNNLLYDERVKRIMWILSGFENTHLNLRHLKMLDTSDESESYNFWDNHPENSSLEAESID